MAAWGKKPPKNGFGNQPVPTDYIEPGGNPGYGTDPVPDQTGVIRPLIKQSNVLQYRGQEYHGVNPNLAGDPPDINANVFDQSAVIVEGQEKEQERAEVPVPVRVVHDDGEWEQALVRTTGMVLSATPITLVSHMRTRTNLLIINNGTVGVYVSDSQQPSQPNSYLIPAGGSFTTKGQNRIYGVTVDGSSQPVSILEEYTVSAQRKPTF